jgi:hypothetical protein
VPEIIDPVFAKTSQNARFLLSEYERFGLVFTKTLVYKFGHGSLISQQVIRAYIQRRNSILAWILLSIHSADPLAEVKLLNTDLSHFLR